MKTQIQQITVDGRKVWQWYVLSGRRIVYGGFSASKADALNDIAILLQGLR